MTPAQRAILPAPSNIRPMNTSAAPPREIAVPYQNGRKAAWLAIPAATVVLAYAIPLLMSYANYGYVLPVMRLDETVYSVRMAAAYRGEGLGNAYLADHDNAPRYLPELTERAIAWFARVAQGTPQSAITAARILQPLAIYTFLVVLALKLGLAPPFAAMAGLLATVFPSALRVAPGPTALPGFLRYLRFVSPGAHVAIFVAALVAVAACWRKPRAVAGIAAGVAVGIVFYLPLYYWTIAWMGLAGLAWLARREQRGPLIIALATSAAIAAPMVVHSVTLLSSPEVHETLARLGLLETGSDLRAGYPRFAGCAVGSVVAWWLRKRSAAAAFVLPFLVASTALLGQSVVTNRGLQSYHFVSAVIPLLAVLAAAALQEAGTGQRALAVVAAALAVGSGAVQAQDFIWLQRLAADQPQEYALSRVMPDTLAWLERHTPPGSVVLAPKTVMDTLAIYTHNKVYWGVFAGQHVISDAEEETRAREVEAWESGKATPRSHRADYELQYGGACGRMAAKTVVFRSEREGTCVGRVARE